jgi:transposase
MVAKQYSQEFKDEAIRQLQGGEISMSQLARNLGVNANTLAAWKKNHLKWQGDPSVLKEGEEAPRAELERLRREVLQLREERDILKKAVGIVSREL